VRFSRLLLIVTILAITCISCKEKGGKYIDQGEIHYNIDYIGNVGTMPKELMPQNLVVSFKKDKILFEMTGIANSGIINLANPEKGIFDTYFSLFALKYFYSAQPDELFPGFEKMIGIKLRKTSKKSVICGYNCKNAEVIFPSARNKVYDIWYTNEIKIENPNAATPFSEIDGVLMNFFFFVGPVELHFEAETVYKKNIPDEAFERRAKFERVSKEKITELINKMISL